VTFLATVAALLLALIVTGALTAGGGYNPISVFLTLSAIWLGVGAIEIWQLVGVWRSADKYIAKKAAQNKAGAWGVQYARTTSFLLREFCRKRAERSC
jgi:hypothetical protein